MKYSIITFITTAIYCSFPAYAVSERISASEFAKDPAKVAALQKAVATMKSHDAADNSTPEFRTSWQYWANTHGYLGSGPNAAGTVATYVPATIGMCGGNPVCVSYYDHLRDTPLPNDGVTEDIWGTCQHGNLNFLPWHRMYLHFFERVMRKQSGDTNFSLPYWDYFDEKGPTGKGIALPELVRGKSAGAMYDQYRTPGLNEYLTAIDPSNGSAKQAFDFTNFKLFSSHLENQPHGAMHCATGSGCRAPDIGQVPLAGLDPVFYLHHANIDRLWQCWLNRKANGQTIDLAWAKANLGMPDSWYDISYQFVDENGQTVSMSIADVFTPGIINVHYANESSCTLEKPVLKKSKLLGAVVPKAMTSLSPVSHTKGVVLKGNALTVPLQATTKSQLLSASPKAMGSRQGNMMLIIENVDIQGDPEVTYKIYISSKRNPNKSVYIATLNYFGVIGPIHKSHSPKSDSSNKIGTLIYDIQEELMELGVQSTSDIAVRFVPSNFIEEISKKQTTKGSVTVGNIRIEPSIGESNQ